MKFIHGSYFCTTSVGQGSGFFSKMISASIRRFEVWKSKDRNAFYTHSGIITSIKGTTFEARNRYGFYSIDDYVGQPIIIGHAVGMTIKNHLYGMKPLLRFDGKRYPYRVIASMMVPGLAHIRPTGYPVCSECDALHAMNSGIPGLKRQIGEWKNQTPDDIADMLAKWDAFQVDFEGIWPGTKRTTE